MFGTPPRAQGGGIFFNFLVFVARWRPGGRRQQGALLKNWPQISRGVKKFILELFLVFPGLEALQRGLPKVLHQVTTFLRCQQGSFWPAKSGFWRLQKGAKTIDSNPKPKKSINPYFFAFRQFCHTFIIQPGGLIFDPGGLF